MVIMVMVIVERGERKRRQRKDDGKSNELDASLYYISQLI